ncbi:lysoplasmalogenase [Undibacterium sp. TJN19]|uniref:lysoplasmalogenase n=1 Tax=Undibacterium sp. TJN19 TaxID=3413055 RepID=UPI003BF0F055
MTASLRSVIIFVFAALAIAGAELAKEIDGARLLHYVFKPLTTLSIFFLVLQGKPAISQRYRKAILTGILFSLLGDIFLMLPSDLFKPGFLFGLLSFLCAHICFLYALSSDCRFFARPVVFIVIATLGIINLFILWPGLPPSLRIPVVAYVCLLLSMAAQAVSRGLVLRTTGSHSALAGGLCFMLSDTLLAYNRFNAPITHSPLLILGSYYLALWLIARSSYHAE